MSYRSPLSILLNILVVLAVLALFLAWRGGVFDPVISLVRGMLWYTQGSGGPPK